jgi:hypothetical protein
VAVREGIGYICKAFMGSNRVSRAVSRVAVAVREGIGSICKAFMGSNRVSSAVSRVAVAVREGIGSFVRHSGEAAELVGP